MSRAQSPCWIGENSCRIFALFRPPGCTVSIAPPGVYPTGAREVSMRGPGQTVTHLLSEARAGWREKERGSPMRTAAGGATARCAPAFPRPLSGCADGRVRRHVAQVTARHGSAARGNASNWRPLGGNSNMPGRLADGPPRRSCQFDALSRTCRVFLELDTRLPYARRTALWRGRPAPLIHTC